MEFLKNGLCPKCNLKWDMEAFSNWAYEIAYDLNISFEDNVRLRCPSCDFEKRITKGDLIEEVWETG